MSVKVPRTGPKVVRFLLKQSVKSSFFLTLFLTLYFCLYIANRYFLPSTTINHWVLVGVVSYLSFIFYDFLYPTIEAILDYVFFPRRLVYKQILENLSKRLSRIDITQRLFRLIVHFFTLSLKIKNAAILFKDKEGVFRLAYQRGYDKKSESGLCLDGRNPLVVYLENEKGSLSSEHVSQCLNQSNRYVGLSHVQYSFELLSHEMKRLKSEAVIPSFLGDEMKIILFLGGRKDKKKFHKDDLSLLFQLTQELTISMENSRLYEEALTKGKQLESINNELSQAQENLMSAFTEVEDTNKKLKDTQAQLLHEQKMVTLGRLSSSVGHEINNPLTILSMNVSRIILKYRKNKDLKVAEVLETFEKIDSNIGRIKSVVNTLTSLLRKHEKGHMQPLSLKLVLEETLPLVQFQTYMDNLQGTEVDFDIPSSVPLIKGDLERLQEVFLNLFINSLQALQGQQEKHIVVRAMKDDSNPEFLHIEFSDNGPGIQNEVMQKIFNFRFTTKKEGKGSGIGLYMCKYILELHGGSIDVKSSEGEGTTFVIKLPTCGEKAHAEVVSH